MTTVQQHGLFGSPTTPHTVIIARGAKVRHFTIRPWALALSAALASAVVAGSVGTTAFLLMQDGGTPPGSVRQERLQTAYEDRIAALRAQLDRVISRQLLDQVTVETKVDLLLDQQVALTERYEKLAPLIDRARSNGLIPTSVPIPTFKPAVPATAPSLEAAPEAEAERVTGGAVVLGFAPSAVPPALERFDLFGAAVATQPPDKAFPWRLRSKKAAAAPHRPATNAISPELIRDIGRSIISVEERQIAGASGLASKARLKAAGIASALRSEGIVVPSERSSLDDAAAVPGSGGPFVPVPEDADFDRSFADLDLALDELQDLSDAAASLPLGAPLADAPVSSTFGVRADPFLGRSALHTGIDFVAETGTRVTVATAGTVVAAGTNGGYGIMVEVDHGGGVVTRYAHLSGVFIAVGDRLGAGDAVGMVGSTGRSTGPHLHYEIRRDGDAVDPARFLRAGRKIRALL